MDNEKMVIIFFCVAILLLAGCKGSFFGKSSTGSGVFKAQDTFKGTDGLTITFSQDMPTSTIDLVKSDNFGDDKTFTGAALIGAAIANKGAVDIKNGYILIQIPNDFTLDKEKLDKTSDMINMKLEKLISFQLNGKSFEMPEGEKEAFSIVAGASYNGLKEKQRGDISLLGCYGYKTILGAEVCVDKNPNNRKGVKVCDVSKEILLAGQGAPIAVTSIKQIASKDGKMQYVVTIQNKGAGKVAAMENQEGMAGLPEKLCSVASVKEEDLNKVIFASAKIGSEESGADITCLPKLIELKKGEGKLKCDVEADAFTATEGETFTTLLNVEFEYAYKIEVKKSVSIESLEGYVEEEKK